MFEKYQYFSTLINTLIYICDQIISLVPLKKQGTDPDLEWKQGKVFSVKSKYCLFFPYAYDLRSNKKYSSALWVSLLSEKNVHCLFCITFSSLIDKSIISSLIDKSVIAKINVAIIFFQTAIKTKFNFFFM